MLRTHYEGLTMVTQCCKVRPVTLVSLLHNIHSRFGAKLYRQTVRIPMGTNGTPLLLICFCFAVSNKTEKRTDMILCCLLLVSEFR